MAQTINDAILKLEEVLKDPTIENIDNAFHYPAILMDKQSFIPSANAQDIQLFFTDFKASMLDKLNCQAPSVIRNESTTFSPSLSSARVTWEFLDANNNPVLSSTFAISLILVHNQYKIVALEPCNAMIPESSKTRSKDSELHRINASKQKLG